MRLRNRRREEEDLRCVVLQMEFWGMASIFFRCLGEHTLCGFSADFYISAEFFRRWVDGLLKWYLISQRLLGYEVVVDIQPALLEP